jgi:glycosyltransferase involved in cell wall biosynthesis
LLGFVDDVRPYDAGASALVLASIREGLPRAVLEAMALETPVIVSASRGNIELVRGGYGQDFPIGSAADLAAAMDRFVDDPANAREMAGRAREHVVREYDLAAVIARHEVLYERLLGGRARPDRPIRVDSAP